MQVRTYLQGLPYVSIRGTKNILEFLRNSSGHAIACNLTSLGFSGAIIMGVIPEAISICLFRGGRQ